MTREESKMVKDVFDKFVKRIEQAKGHISDYNYGLAMDALCRDLPKMEIKVDSPESYKPVGKETLNSFIYKGIKWLEDKFSEHDESSGRGEWMEIRSWDFDSMEEMIKDFRKTMEADA